MAELIENDPCIARIVDLRTSRSLLDDPSPLEAELEGAKTIAFPLRIENGAQAPLDLTITSDQEWLETSPARFTLRAGASADCEVRVRPKGQGEFANLCFSWKGSAEIYKAYVLVWRKGKPEIVKPAASPAPAQGVWDIPDWLKGT